MHGHKTCTAFCLGVLLVVQEFGTSCLLSILFKNMQAVNRSGYFCLQFKITRFSCDVRSEHIFVNVVPSVTAGTQHPVM